MIYLFEHPETGEVKEVWQGMNEEHKFVDDAGLQWNRVFTVPNANFDTQIDPFSAKKFVEKTKNYKGSLGDLFNMSKDLAEQRKSKDGVDVVEKQTVEKYEKDTGLKHPSRVKKIGDLI